MSKVTRCVCFNITFKELKEISDKNNCKNILELKQFVVFSQKCKLCLPYVEKMFETGKTEFEIIS